jgi:hypothetical protein
MKQLTIGTLVRMTSFDGYGFTGRDLHPSKEDVGFVGRIIAILEVSIAETDEESSYACVRVKSAVNGQTLDLIDSELTVI